MHVAYFFVVTAALEAGAGACFLLLPAVPFEWLLGVGRPAPEAELVGRVAGAALLSLGVAGWLGRSAGRNPARRGLLAGLLVYNASVAALLVYAAVGINLSGWALWPTVALHAGMAGWNVACLRIESRPTV